MRSEGRGGPFTRFTFSDNNPGWGWSAVSESRRTAGVTWITEDGPVSHEESWDYIRNYNNDMEAAAAASHCAFGSGSFAGSIEILLARYGSLNTTRRFSCLRASVALSVMG